MCHTLDYPLSRRDSLPISSFDINHPYEWLTLPNLKKMYLSTYPMWLIRDLSFKKFSLQCNDFMLFDGNVYRNFQPFEFSKHDKSKNIAYFLKSEGVKVDYFIGDNRILIDNDGTIKKCLYELINSLNCFLKGKKTIILIYSFIMCFWWVPFIFNFIPGLFILSLIILFASQYFIAYITRSTVSESFIYFIPQFYFLFYSIIRSLLHMRHIKRKASH